jgi:uncharacterized protein with FMN-binding domain
MRRITTWLLSTLSALVLLFSYHTSTDSSSSTSQVQAAGTSGTGSVTSSGSSSSGSSASSGSSSSSTTSSSGSSGSSGSMASGTVAGDTVQTRWGAVQVQITVQNGKITAADVVQVPSENPKDQEINSYAVPILNSEAVSAQSADIDMVSGATVTSEGYLQSLQSAIDAANL